MSGEADVQAGCAVHGCPDSATRFHNVGGRRCMLCEDHYHAIRLAIDAVLAGDD